MAAAAKSVVEVVNDMTGEVKKPSEAIAERKSKELVVAFAGPIGCGVKVVKEKFEEVLLEAGYTVHHIKISDYLQHCIDDGIVKTASFPQNDRADRYIALQNVGNILRQEQGDILAEYAIQRIAEIRTKDIKENESVTDYVPVRTAYLVDQLKHQDEVSLLRAVYGNLFFLFGVLSTSGRRATRLRADGVPEGRISELVERDRRQREKSGQQLDKALQLADFFIRNEHANATELEDQIERSVDLMHGVNGISPTRAEYGMYAAYASGLRSACLSRQVGASIMNAEGMVIATGRNDVPKAGGGLYGPEDGKSDARCVKREEGHCFNDFHKHQLAADIRALINTALSDSLAQLMTSISAPEKDVLRQIDIASLSSGIAHAAYDDTRLGGLIEFSRSIHAEMDAIVSLALNGSGSTRGATLFTYTFPCHNCARHIVAAGIETVYYLEPYEKSLAIDLHGDAIQVDGRPGNLGDGIDEEQRVAFIHFEGVAPRQYLNMFTPSGERKDRVGKVIKINARSAEKKVPEYLDDYREYELKVVEHLSNVIKGLKDKNLQG